jgi:transposase
MARPSSPIQHHYPPSDREATRFQRIYLDAALEGIILYERKSFLSSLMKRMRSILQEAGTTA